MNRDTTQELLRHFLDYERPSMSAPFWQELKIGKSICATDGKSVLIIPYTDENAVENDVEIKNYPNVDAILPDFSSPAPLDFKHLLKVYTEIPIEEFYPMETCYSCDGDGKFSHYGEVYSCKKCDQSGKVQSQYKIKDKNPNIIFKFKDTHLSIEMVRNIFLIYGAMQKENFEFKMSSAPHTWVFRRWMKSCLFFYHI